jgi:hypothetical protein
MKEWTSPELTVLVRSNPEEAVLTGCKTYGVPTGPGMKWRTCDNVINDYCFLCEENVPS